MSSSMNFSGFLQPITDALPSGEDLDLNGDSDYSNYVFPAESRLPSQYLDSTGKVVFDRSQIDIDNEITQVNALLERSRDLRLIALLAQFSSATLNLDMFANSLSFARDLLNAQWATVHPVPENGDFTMRRIAIEAIDDRIRVAIPLAYMPLVRSKTAGTITFRSYEIAAKPSLKREAETPLPLSTVTDAIRAADSREELARSLQCLQAAIGALKDISAMFDAKVEFDQVAAFPNTLSALEDIHAAILALVPELNPGYVQAAAELPSEPIIAVVQVASVRDALVEESVPSVSLLSCHGEAISMMDDVESYFVKREPSSPALLLVHQARKLIGRPLIEAVEALVGSRTDTIQIRLGSASGFTLTIDRLRQLSSSAAGAEPILPVRRADQQPVLTRQNARDAMIVVERYLADAEPSSPVPLLLSKARQLMSRDFSDVLNEMISPADSNG